MISLSPFIACDVKELSSYILIYEIFMRYEIFYTYSSICNLYNTYKPPFLRILRIRMYARPDACACSRAHTHIYFFHLRYFNLTEISIFAFSVTAFACVSSSHVVLWKH